jgi:DMSO/TMAO reductase YedYZ molybdopterin-dependent catalytic subunit
VLDPTKLVGIFGSMNALVDSCTDSIFFPEVPPMGSFSEDPWIRHFNQVTPDFFSQPGSEPPQVDLPRYRLTVAGLVSRTSQFSIGDLRFDFPEHELAVQTRDEVSGQSREVTWQGCRIEDVLDFVGVSHPGAYLEFIGSSGSGAQDRGPFAGLVAAGQLRSRPLLLGWAIDGKPLTVAQGAPLAALIPEIGGYRCIRRLHRINLLVLPPLWAPAQTAAS